jgi:DNA topoisomerase-3
MNEANYKGEVKRLWISSLTTEAIREGFENHHQTTILCRQSQELVGMNATRLYTVKHGGYKQVLSVGANPTLAMVVDRYAAIENFKPQPYWELQTLYRDIL